MSAPQPDLKSRLDAVASLRARLADSGFRPLAVFNHNANVKSPGKQPVGEGWEERARRDPPADAVAPPDRRSLNTGLLCDGLRVVDADIDHPALAHQVRALAVQHFGETIIRSRSNSPGSYCRTARPPAARLS